ncbi:hypothetical protein H0N99_04510 [Candidatus Micrarchaeota archaeon]|nr:hypothetical protein [Candidatus Micrarchaeota archaeon]
MAWVKEEPMEKKETKAGTIQLRVAESPLMITRNAFFGRSDAENWERREAKYDVFLTRPGSDEEEKIGYVTVRHRRIGDLRASRLHDIFTGCGLKDDDRTVMIEDFYPVGKKGEEKNELGEKPELKRNRIGSKALEIVLEECKTEGVASAYCSTRETAMQALLEHVGFKKTEYLYTKML